jgi:GNAT superfamily N-acetyltransferase
LSPEDIDAIKEVASIYLSDLEIQENEGLFVDSCRAEANETFGFGSTQDSDLVGFLVGTIKTEDESLDEHLNRPTPISTETRTAIFQHLYVVPDNWGQGTGTRLFETALEFVESRGVEEIYAEAWINPETPDAVPILKKGGFEEIYHSKDYWSHDAFVASSVPCPSHDRSYSECPCEGAIYAKTIE